jgi:hypothetical protein
MANNGPTFTRLGPGDLPGDSSHPYVEPVFGMDEAIRNVADLLPDWDIGEIVSEIIEAADALRWIAANETIPVWWPTPHLDPFRALLKRAESLEKLAEDEHDALNAQDDPRGDEDA